jgi:hypothetical protein
MGRDEWGLLNGEVQFQQQIFFRIKGMGSRETARILHRMEMDHPLPGGSPRSTLSIGYT